MSMTSLGPRYREALVFAAELHQHQYRKHSPVPYISHLLAVSGLVIEAGGNEDEAIAGLLHDGPEDCGGLETLRKIRDRFGTEVAAIVEGCSETFAQPKPAWRPRKEAYLARLATESDSVHLVSSADKLHNARAMLMDYRREGETLWSRFNAGREEQFWFYDELIRIYRARNRSPLVDELARTIETLRELAGESRSTRIGA